MLLASMSTPPQKRSKPRPWDQMTESERSDIIEAVENGGFGSEMQVRRIFQREGFDARSFYFHDLDDNRTRELDVLAYRRMDGFTPGGQLSHMVVAEVKSGYVWVLGEDVDEDFEANNVIIQSEPRWFSAAKGSRILQDPQWEELAACVHGEHLKAQGVTASIHQKKSEKGGDAWYEAATKVFKAATHKLSQSFRDTDFFLSIPLVVLDGNLLAAKFGSDGKLTLDPREHAQVLFSFASDRYRNKEIAIHVVTLAGLPKFLKLVSTDGVRGSELGKTIYKSLSDRERRPPPELIL